MTTIHMRTFSSPWDFLKKLINLLRGPFIVSSYFSFDGKLREKILLTVTQTNNCFT